MDGRAEFTVADEPAVRRIHAGCEGGSIDLRRAGIDGMVATKKCPVLPELFKRRRIGGADHVRAQTIPRDDDHMIRLACCLSFWKNHPGRERE